MSLIWEKTNFIGNLNYFKLNIFTYLKIEKLKKNAKWIKIINLIFLIIKAYDWVLGDIKLESSLNFEVNFI